MNFNTDKMAKSLGLPSKSYLTEMKQQCPVLFGKIETEYDDGFKKFFNDISNRIKQMIEQEIDIKKFIETCLRNFEAKKELEKEMLRRRQVMTLPPVRTVTVSKPEPKESPKKMKPLPPVNDYIWSDDEETAVCDHPYTNLKTRFDALEKDYAMLNMRYSQCKLALTNQISIKNDMEREIEKLRNENEMLKKNCICQNIEHMILKRKRVDQ